ncbi:MAG: hypothetical protein AAF764_12370, partial [Pseudomonadota bacterium]
ARVVLERVAKNADYTVDKNEFILDDEGDERVHLHEISFNFCDGVDGILPIAFREFSFEVTDLP